MSEPDQAVARDTADLGALRRRLDAAGHDVVALKPVVDALSRREDDEGISLWMLAAGRLAAARKTTGLDERDALGRFLGRRALAHADGRPLHRYRASAEEFAALGRQLSAAGRRLERPRPRDAAIFVLYGAEWFRRCFAGGVPSWKALTEVFGELPYQANVELTREGLRWWRREVRRLNGANEWFFTLRLEGGFPSRLLDSQERGWLQSHLRRLIATVGALGDEATVNDAVELALDDFTIPRTFRTPGFATLCAELAVAIVALRRRHGAQATAAGMRLSAWLDASELTRRDADEPTWRDALSIEGEGASRLLDDLVSDSLNRLGGAGARCERLLVKVGDDWRPALNLGVDGEPTLPPSLRGTTSRLHAYPSGILADLVSGAVCVLEPSDDGGPWLARPRVGAPRALILDFPLAGSVSIELRSEGKSITTVTWANGEPVRSEVLTFVPKEAGDHEPRLLTLAAIGSCRNQHPVVYVRAPAVFVATGSCGEPVEPIWSGDGHQLFRLTTTAHVGLKDGEFFYRIEPGADSDEADRLSLKGNEVCGVTTGNGDPVFAGIPEIRKQSSSVIAQDQKDLVWRPAGTRDWHDVRRAPIRHGLIEILWQDPASRAARDRRRIAIMPDATVLKRQSLANGAARFDLEGAKGWRLLSTGTPTAQTTDRQIGDDGCNWRMSWNGAEERTVSLRLAGPDNALLDIEVAYPFSAGRFVRPDGRSFPDNAPVTLERLKGSRGVADGTSVLWIETHGPGLRATHRLRFDDEIALWSLRDVVSALLAEAGDLDSEAWLGFEPNGSRLRVKRYEIELPQLHDVLTLPPTAAPPTGEITLRWRSFVHTGDDGVKQIQVISAEAFASGCLVTVPQDLPGPGIAYLADAGIPISRPILVVRPHADADDLTPLQRAVLVNARHQRDLAIDAALKMIGERPSQNGADLAWLHAHLAMADALVPSTFRAFSLLAFHPRTLAALVAWAPDDAARDRVWNLERQLPLLWALVGVEDWSFAFGERERKIRSELETAGLGEQSARYAREAVESAAEAFAAFDETLRMTFLASGLSRTPPSGIRQPKLIAQDYIRGLAALSEPRSVDSCFHTAAVMPGLKAHCAWLSDFDESHHEALQAPIVAALQAGGRLMTLSGKQRLRIRESMIQDHQYFADAYATALMAIGR